MYIFFLLFCNLYFHFCCNPKLHKCLFLPSGHRFVNLLGLLVYSFLLHCHGRSYEFERVCRWQSPKTFFVHFDSLVSFSVVLPLAWLPLAQLSLPERLAAIGEEPWWVYFIFVVKWRQARGGRAEQGLFCPRTALHAHFVNKIALHFMSLGRLAHKTWSIIVYVSPLLTEMWSVFESPIGLKSFQT